MPTYSFAGPSRREKLEKPSNFGVSYLRTSNAPVPAANTERIRRERNAVSEAAAEAEKRAARKVTELQREIERLKTKAEAAHERADRSNRTSAAYKNAHAAEVRLKQEIEDEYDALHEAQLNLSTQKAASNKKVRELEIGDTGKYK